MAITLANKPVIKHQINLWWLNINYEFLCIYGQAHKDTLGLILVEAVPGAAENRAHVLDEEFGFQQESW